SVFFSFDKNFLRLKTPGIDLVEKYINSSSAHLFLVHPKYSSSSKINQESFTSEIIVLLPKSARTLLEILIKYPKYQVVL
ncbi:MAG TPA: hypothetical protein VLH77_06705, partial [Gammaproteobacteria bacterium]|nr:hypothetical protein [Gammaproteobacteria bacterium]